MGPSGRRLARASSGKRTLEPQLPTPLAEWARGDSEGTAATPTGKRVRSRGEKLFRTSSEREQMHQGRSVPEADPRGHRDKGVCPTLASVMRIQALLLLRHTWETPQPEAGP